MIIGAKSPAPNRAGWKEEWEHATGCNTLILLGFCCRRKYDHILVRIHVFLPVFGLYAGQQQLDVTHACWPRHANVHYLLGYNEPDYGNGNVLGSQ